MPEPRTPRPAHTSPAARQQTADPLLPLPTRSRLAPLLLALIALSLIPALLLAVGRVRFEAGERTVAEVMDYNTLSVQANLNGLSPLALLAQYRQLGVNGVAIYEDTVATRINRGELYLKSGGELAAENPGAGVNSLLTYVRELKPGVLAGLRARYNIATSDVTVGGRRWSAWPVDPGFLPAGPNLALIRSLQAQGYVVVYRPYDNPAVRAPGADWPDVPFLAFNDNEVFGARDPALLTRIRARIDRRPDTLVPAIIEFTPQKGLDTLIAGRSAVRLFSISGAWQDLLTPDETASKFVLAARERSHKLLYMRPFRTVADTRTFLTEVRAGLQKAGIATGRPQASVYEPSTLLRSLALVGPLAALLLVGLSYPLPRVGLVVAALAALFCLGLNGGQPLPGAALIAAISFPSLGLVLRRHTVWDWFVATGFSLLGVFFVSALGADRDSVLGLDPFRGVGLTLFAPILLVALSFLPRQDIRKTVADIYHAPLKLGDIIIMALGLAAFALVFLRRGNTTGAGVSDAEAKVRQSLQDSIIRPRFKEVFGHPLLLLGLSGILPGYFTLLLLLGGVVGQASILNTFSHFHTPLLISFQRALIGLGTGLVLGVIALALVRLGLRLWARFGMKPGQGGGPGEVRVASGQPGNTPA